MAFEKLVFIISRTIFGALLNFQPKMMAWSQFLQVEDLLVYGGLLPQKQLMHLLEIDLGSWLDEQRLPHEHPQTCWVQVAY